MQITIKNSNESSQLLVGAKAPKTSDSPVDVSRLSFFQKGKLKMKVCREVKSPKHGVLKKRISEFNKALISELGRTIRVGAKVWTLDGTFKVLGGANGKVFVTPARKRKGNFVREVTPESLNLKWVEVNSLTEIALPNLANADQDFIKL